MVVQDIMLKDIPPKTIAYLRCKGSWRQLRDILERLDEYLSRRQVKAIGPASGIYYNTPSEVGVQDLKWEVFHPVETDTPESVDDKTGFGIRNLQETKMASIAHRGSYLKAGSSCERLKEWIRREGLEVCSPSEEIYLSVFGVPSEGQMMEIHLPLSSA